MISAGDFHRGVIIEMDGDLYRVLEYQHTKIAQRANIIKVKLKNVRDGRVLERNVPSSEKFTLARLDTTQVQYLYSDGALYHFMDTKTFEQQPMGREQLGDAVDYLKEGLTLQLVCYQGQPLGVELPITVELKVTDTAPGYRGDTAQGGTKPATLETGLAVKVPLYVNEGETVKVDTRTGAFVERVH